MPKVPKTEKRKGKPQGKKQPLPKPATTAQLEKLRQKLQRKFH
jgi:hypothetical protein